MTRRLDELNALEEAEAEKVSGIPITNLEEEERPKVALLGALAWVHAKRTDPKLKYTDYMTSRRTRDIANYLFGSDEEDAAAEAEKADGDLAAVVDPFPSEVAAVGVAEVGAVEAHAEGAVLSGDRIHA